MNSRKRLTWRYLSEKGHILKNATLILDILTSLKTRAVLPESEFILAVSCFETVIAVAFGVEVTLRKIGFIR